MPSYVAFTDSERLIGDAAKNQVAMNPINTVFEGVVLSYNQVEADSIKKLVADIQRLSNARMFALGMRKLLGASTDERLEESNVNPGSKPSAGAKSVEANPPFLSFKIHQYQVVGRALPTEMEEHPKIYRMKLWATSEVPAKSKFCFGSGVLARFVIEWEAGKEGCTMHVSPDQLWPHTNYKAWWQWEVRFHFLHRLFQIISNYIEEIQLFLLHHFNNPGYRSFCWLWRGRI